MVISMTEFLHFGGIIDIFDTAILLRIPRWILALSELAILILRLPIHPKPMIYDPRRRPTGIQ